MLYLLAIVLPPVAVLLTGRPGQALLNCLLTLCLWVPGIIHAILVINEHKANKRMDRLGNRIVEGQRRNADRQIREQRRNADRQIREQRRNIN